MESIYRGVMQKGKEKNHNWNVYQKQVKFPKNILIFFYFPFSLFFRGLVRIWHWKFYIEVPLSEMVASFTWSTAFGFTYEMISWNRSTTTNIIMIIMEVRIYYVPWFQRMLFCVITC